MSIIQAAAVLLGVLQALYSIYLIPLSLSLYRKLSRTSKSSKENVINTSPTTQNVAVVIPVYKEKPESLIRTVRSIMRQDYPRNLMHVYLVVEDGDDYTSPAVNAAMSVIQGSGIPLEVIRVHCTRVEGKACALNKALLRVHEEVFMVFDADDVVPSDYIKKAVEKLRGNNVVAVTTKVYRVGDKVHAKFLTMDTVLWYDVILPVLAEVSDSIPLSGEGLTIKTEYLKKIGGFPVTLTEDAHLAIYVIRDGAKVSYLNDTYIVEKAPKSVKSHFRQRLRWFQGYYQCFIELLKSLISGKVRLRKSLSLLFSYFSPVVSVATVLTHTLFIVYWVLFLLRYEPGLHFFSLIFPPPVFYWGFFNLIVGNTYIMYLMLYTVSDSKFEDIAPYAILMPIYWYLTGVISTTALLAPREWRKTER